MSCVAVEAAFQSFTKQFKCCHHGYFGLSLKTSVTMLISNHSTENHSITVLIINKFSKALTKLVPLSEMLGFFSAFLISE